MNLRMGRGPSNIMRWPLRHRHRLPLYLTFPPGVTIGPVRRPTLNTPSRVLTFAPRGSDRLGRGRWAATTHLPSADGQYTQPFLLQMSISPLSFTDHAHRAPVAVLSMHMLTAS